MAPVRYARRPNPYAHFNRLPDADIVRNAQPSSQGKRILLLPIRVSPTSNLLEGVIGAGLKLDGHFVCALLDGGTLPYSENRSFGKSWAAANALSVFEQRKFCQTFAIQPCYYDDQIDHARLASLIRQIKALPYDALAAFQYNGVAVGQHARFGLVRYLKQETVDLPENTRLLQQFLITALKTALAVEAVIRQKQITHAFMSHGIYSTWGTALDVLVAAGVEVSVWGRGYVGGSPIFGRNQSYLLEAINETHADVERLSAPYSIDDAFLDEYFTAKEQPGSGVDAEAYYDTRDPHVPKTIGTLRDGYDGLVSVFPNIPWDGTMFAASDYTPSLRSFAATVIRAAHQFPRLRFVVRCHPAERHRFGNNSRETFASFFTAQDRKTANLIILEADAAISSYDLLPVTDAALVFGTTMGLELAFREIPVIQTGRFHLSGKGVVFEVTSDQDLWKLLENVQNSTLSFTDEMRRNIRHYAHFHIRLCHVQDDMIKVNRFSFERYLFDRAAMLGGDRLKSCSAIKRYILGETEKCLNPYAESQPETGFSEPRGPTAFEGMNSHGL